ncbi:unnamed protein product [Allacma fusca]|uniref:Uncharacterized protein n=1 Tax=Allacma fusca TaxID=39272 RepID=A0A8J2JXE4_9HEXA|nr:unnamed protein product [Allacma fusca]
MSHGCELSSKQSFYKELLVVSDRFVRNFWLQGTVLSGTPGSLGDRVIRNFWLYFVRDLVLSNRFWNNGVLF